MHVLVSDFLNKARVDRDTVDISQLAAELAGEGFGAMPGSARDFLDKWCGTNSELRGPGLECAVEPFVIDPLRCIGENARLADAGAKIGVALYPIGEAGGGQSFLAMDEAGTIYSVWPTIVRLGLGEAALEVLVLGQRGRWLANP